MPTPSRRKPRVARRQSAYSKAQWGLLIAAALKSVPDVFAVAHVLPRAYCVAKPAAHCAVFAIPEMDREPHVKDDAFHSVQNESAAPVKLGDWCAIAYISAPGCGQFRVIKT